MSLLPAALAPIAVQHSDVLVLDALTRYVAQSGMQIGERLPPEQVLAEQLAVSRNTVRATADDLLLIEQRLLEMERVHLAVGSAGAEDWLFHSRIYQAAHNPLLLHMVVLLDRFLDDAVEVDVDAICDGEQGNSGCGASAG